MGRDTFLFLLFFICLLSGCGKDNASYGDADALRNLLNTAQESRMDPLKREKLLDSVNTSIQSRQNDSITRLLTQIVAWHYADNANHKKALAVSKRFYNMAVAKNDSLRMAHGLYYIANYHFSDSNNDSALYYYHKSGKLFLKVHDTINAARTVQNNIGILYSNGSYAEVEAIASKTLKLNKKIKSNELIYGSYLYIGLALLEMKNYDKAKEYLTRALNQTDHLEKEGFDKIMLLQHRAACINNLGLIHQYKGEYPQAIFYYNKVMAMPDIKQLAPGMFAAELSARAYCKIMMHHTGSKVLADLYESQHIWNRVQDKESMAFNETRIGEFYLMKHDTAKALGFIKKGYLGSKSVKCNIDVLHALNVLAMADRKKSSYYSHLYFKVNDSLQGVERATRNKFARIAYETDTIKDKNEALGTRFIYILAACSVLLLATAGFFLIFRLRARNRQLVYEQQQQMVTGEIYSLLMQQEAEAEKAKMKERSRIAAHLNKEVLQHIFTINEQLRSLETTEQEKKLLLVNELCETGEGIQKLSQGLKENFLSGNESFADALKALLLQQQQIPGIIFNLYVDASVNINSLLPGQRVAIFRIVQEACTNAKKYSGATNCSISLTADSAGLKLRICDDGTGFDPKKTGEGIGLRNIRERAEALGGTFNNLSAPSNGTLLDIVI